MAGGPIELWNEWAIQILVLLSFTLQVFLLIFAGIRRHEDCHVLRLLVWLAYQMADSTAIYALVHLSLSGVPRDHQLVAFWAPFLLLHLGGPDNITAYSLEDNKLWKRHLLTAIVQVLGAAYVLYKHIAVSGSLVVVAAVMMFVVGVLKYGERIWALQCSNLDSIRSAVKKEPPFKYYAYPEYDEVDLSQGQLHEEFLLRRAHSVFHICKSAAVDSSVPVDPNEKIRESKCRTMWGLVEMELSLLYDILYTKAALIHTWHGYCIRAISPLATAGSFLLFQFSSKGGHSRVDVAVTYALLVGAFFLEMISLLRALGSSWTFAYLCECDTRWSWLRHAALCRGRWDRFRRVVLSLRRLVMIGSYRSRRWSGTIGQYNLFHLCTGHTGLLGRLAEMLGLNERWNKFHYSETLVIPDDVKQMVFKQHEKQMSDPEYVNALGLIRGRWGEQVLKHYNLHEDLKSRVLDVELQECILGLHIATDVFLANRNQAKAQDAVHGNVRAIEIISNYMMFLLVKRPYLLPGSVL